MFHLQNRVGGQNLISATTVSPNTGKSEEQPEVVDETDLQVHRKMLSLSKEVGATLGHKLASRKATENYDHSNWGGNYQIKR